MQFTTFKLFILVEKYYFLNKTCVLHLKLKKMKNFKNYFASVLRLIYVKNIDYKKTPIIINNFNRLSTTVQLIDALKQRGYNNIHILDNQSTYPPLLEFYKKRLAKFTFSKKIMVQRRFGKAGCGCNL